MGFTKIGLLIHQNGSSPELESRSDFDFSSAFDNVSEESVMEESMKKRKKKSVLQKRERNRREKET
jgi:hypothetical protein